MASKTKYVRAAENIIFRSKSLKIPLSRTKQSEAGKTLQIEGSSSGSGPGSLTTTKPTTSLGPFDYSSAKDLVGPKQIKASLSDLLNKYCLVIGNSASGPVANIWKYDTSGSWVEEAVLGENSGDYNRSHRKIDG
jgi:hypothetical protein